jgi:hypothetical protein
MIAHRYKYLGIAFLLCGLALTILFMVHRVAITIPVLAVSSSYIQTRYFAIMKTNVYEEITMLCFLAGFLLTVFSKEKMEKEGYEVLRYESWKTSVLINSALLAFSIFFIYGKGFAAMLILNMFSLFAIYLVVFLIKKDRYRQKPE